MHPSGERSSSGASFLAKAAFSVYAESPSRRLGVSPRRSECKNTGAEQVTIPRLRARCLSRSTRWISSYLATAYRVPKGFHTSTGPRPLGVGILPMLKPFSWLRTKYVCRYRAHKLQETLKRMSCKYANVTHGRRTHMHGGDEHQSMP